MKAPVWLKVTIGFLVLAGFAGFVCSIRAQSEVLKRLADLTLVLTLAVLILYSYYTYLIARDTWTPSASFAIVPLDDSPYHFAFVIRNHSKLSLCCWCKLNATVYGQPVPLDGFYGGKTSFDVQPFGISNGHFDTQGDILARVNRTLEEMKEKARGTETKRQLYLDIEFWYHSYGSTHSEVHNPKQPHYFDFARNRMIAAF